MGRGRECPARAAALWLEPSAPNVADGHPPAALVGLAFCFLPIFPVDRRNQENSAVLGISPVHDNARGKPDGDQVRGNGDVADQRVANDAAAVVQ